MLFKCHVTYVLWVIWAQNAMVKFIFNRGKVNFRSNYVKSNQISKIKIFLPKYAYLVQFCLRIQKNVIYFYVRQLKMPKNAFQKCAVITFTFFWAIAQLKTKILLWKFVFMLFVLLRSNQFRFFGYLENFGFVK